MDEPAQIDVAPWYVIVDCGNSFTFTEIMFDNEAHPNFVTIQL